MANIELTEKETAVLTEILESSLMDLRTERVRTENRQFHAAVVEREHVLQGVIKRLTAAK
jgi:hypothetical protein